MNIRKIIKDWMLPIAMMTGASSYLLYHYLPFLHTCGPLLSKVVGIIQPLLIFLMLFLTFCRIEPRDLKPHRWHWWLLLIQGGIFSLLGLIAYLLVTFFAFGGGHTLVLLESAMLCLICPTATAAAVVTRKLGGDVPGITTYIVLINLLTAFLVPLVVPLIHPVAGFEFWTSFRMIMAKVFPMLILPCLAAWLVRYIFPRFHRWLSRFPDAAFYIWACALSLAIALTTKAVIHSTLSVGILLVISFISLLCCIFQFTVGRYIGSRYVPHAGRGLACDSKELERRRQMRKVTAGQSLGQKNTIFAIWMGYTFMTPETAIVGGLYSIWHNIYNTWQLYRHSSD